MAEVTPASRAHTVLDFLRKLDLPVEVHHHPPVFTVAEAQALRGEIPGGHTKNLFLKDRKNRYFLVTTMEDAQIDLKTLHQRVDSSGRLSFASPEHLEAILGVQPGAVSPLGLVDDTGKDCSLVLDMALFAAHQVNFHPLDNSMTISISPANLEIFLKATGHAPLKLDFPSSTTLG